MQQVAPRRGRAAKPLRHTAILTALCIVLAQGGVASAQADARGKQLFEECAACHVLKPQDDGNVGPSLTGLFGRKAGSRDDFRYSGPMKRSGLDWNRGTLDQFLSEPQALVPGNRMPYSGMTDAADRKALIDYLEQITR
jgi:cytochrome c